MRGLWRNGGKSGGGQDALQGCRIRDGRTKRFTGSLSGATDESVDQSCVRPMPLPLSSTRLKACTVTIGMLALNVHEIGRNTKIFSASNFCFHYTAPFLSGHGCTLGPFTIYHLLAIITFRNDSNHMFRNDGDNF